MTSTSRITTRLASAGAIAASIALGVQGVIQITDEQSGQSTVVGVEHVTLAGLTATLLCLIPAVVLLGRIAGRPRAAAISCTGQVVLALLTVVSNVRGEDPSFFAAVAIPSNLLWFGAWVALAVALKRGRLVPAAVAVGLPLSWIFALPLSSLGGSLVAGAFWLTVGWMLGHDALQRRGAPHAEPARA
jgi:hypothetical protein